MSLRLGILAGIVFATATSVALAADVEPLPPNAVEFSCKLVNFKNTKKWQLVDFIFDSDNYKAFDFSTATDHWAFGKAIRFNGVADIKTPKGMIRLVAPVDIVDLGGTASAGVAGFHFGTAGLLGGVGLGIELPDDQAYNESILNEILGCYLLL